MRKTPSDERYPLQGHPARKKSTGDSRLNDWAFTVLTDRDLTGRAVSVGLFLRDIFDFQTGFASPSIRAIGAATGLSRGSAERAVRTLVAAGHLRLIAGGGGSGNANLYKLGGLG